MAPFDFKPDILGGQFLIGVRKNFQRKDVKAYPLSGVCLEEQPGCKGPFRLLKQGLDLTVRSRCDVIFGIF